MSCSAVRACHTEFVRRPEELRAPKRNTIEVYARNKRPMCYYAQIRDFAHTRDRARPGRPVARAATGRAAQGRAAATTARPSGGAPRRGPRGAPGRERLKSKRLYKSEEGRRGPDVAHDCRFVAGITRIREKGQSEKRPADRGNALTQGGEHRMPTATQLSVGRGTTRMDGWMRRYARPGHWH